MALGSDDIQEMIEDLADAGGAVRVTLNGVTAYGLRDTEAVELLGVEMPGVIGAEEMIHVQAEDFPTAASHQDLTVDGVAWRILKVLPYGDGAMMRLALTKQ